MFSCSYFICNIYLYFINYVYEYALRFVYAIYRFPWSLKLLDIPEQELYRVVSPLINMLESKFRLSE